MHIIVYCLFFELVFPGKKKSDFLALLSDFFIYSWLARTDPKDVARVESKTVIVTTNKRDTVPIPADGAQGQLGNWMSPGDFERAKTDRFPGCMKG